MIISIINDTTIEFFNYTNNKYSYEKLVQLINTKLTSIELIQERQKFLQFLIQQNFTNNFYSAFDLYECILFTNQLQIKYEYLIKNKLKTNFKLNTNYCLKEKIRSEIFQLINILKKIKYNIYYKLEKGKLPQHLQIHFNSLQEIESLLKIENLNIDKIEVIITNNYIYNFLKTGNAKIFEEKIKQFWNHFFELESFISIAIAIKKHSLSFASITKNEFNLENFYLPHINNCVKNNISIQKNCLIITGPNMSGKSVLLKSILNCVWLTHIGLAIPASDSRIPFYENIFAHLNNTDDITKGYSQFYNELIELKKIVTNLEKNQTCFCIFDEMYSGTNISDAEILFNKTINKFEQCNGSLFLISTHLNIDNEIAKINFKNTDLIYLSTQLNNNDIKFEYKITKGISKLKLGQVLFEKLELQHFFK